MRLPKTIHKYAVCALILNENMEVLGVTRKDDHSDWGLPGGKVDAQESLDVALQREVLEETGYTVDILDMYDINFHFCQKENGYQCLTYICTINEEIPVQPIDEKETGLVGWIPLKYLLEGSFKKYNRNCLKHFNLLDL